MEYNVQSYASLEGVKTQSSWFDLFDLRSETKMQVKIIMALIVLIIVKRNMIFSSTAHGLSD